MEITVNWTPMLSTRLPKTGFEIITTRAVVIGQRSKGVLPIFTCEPPAMVVLTLSENLRVTLYLVPCGQLSGVEEIFVEF